MEESWVERAESEKSDTCTFPGCGRPAHRGEDCRGHYEQRRKTGERATLSELHSKAARGVTEDPRKALLAAATEYVLSPDDDEEEYARRERTLIRQAQTLARERPRVPESVKRSIRNARSRGSSLRDIAKRYAVDVKVAWRICKTPGADSE
jgi:hypothetical protein